MRTSEDNFLTSYNDQKVLNDILRLTLSPHLPGKQLELILEYLFSVTRLHLIEKAAIFLTDQKAKKLVLKAQRGLPSGQIKNCREIPFGVCHCGAAAADGTIQFFPCNTSSSSPNCMQREPHGHLCLPIIRDSSTIGIVCFYVAHGHIPSEEEKALLSNICHIIDVIIEQEEMDTQLVDLVKDLSDSLTSLRNEKKFSDSIIQGLNQGLLVVDLKGNIQRSNPVAGAILQSYSPILEGRNLADIVGTETAEHIMHTSTPGNTENELTLTPGKDEKKIISYTTVSRDDATGKQVGHIISFTDISEIKYVRKEMEKMNRLSTVAEIAAAVAHEVRNPLAGIKIMAQSIEEESITREEQRECSRRIVRQVDRLNELLTEFFTYARPVTPRIRPISLVDILAETRHLIGNKLTKKQIVFRERYETDLPLVNADPNQLQQVFLNLFLNSIDAIRHEGIIDVAIRLLEDSDFLRYKRKYPGLLTADHHVMMRFSDNGAGMSPDTAEKVFEPFFTTKTTGSGLGLSIVYRTLKENGAAIAVNSIEGKGTTFTLFFRTPA